MASDDLKAAYRRGLMPLLILKLLQERDMYGYELVEAVKGRTDGQVQTKEGSLYPVLYKLSEEGFISEHRVVVGKRLARVYYSLESAGAQHVALLEQEYRAITSGVLHLLEWKQGVDEPVPDPTRPHRKRAPHPEEIENNGTFNALADPVVG